MNAPTMTFDAFEVGAVLGSQVVAVAPLVAGWEALFPVAPSTTVPAGLLVSIMMRGYLSVLDLRPKGNVHAGQKLSFGEPAPRDAELTVAVRCSGKERRGEHKWLTFVTTVTGAGGATHLTGEMRSLWAA